MAPSQSLGQQCARPHQGDKAPPRYATPTALLPHKIQRQLKSRPGQEPFFLISRANNKKEVSNYLSPWEGLRCTTTVSLAAAGGPTCWGAGWWERPLIGFLKPKPSLALHYKLKIPVNIQTYTYASSSTPPPCPPSWIRF